MSWKIMFFVFFIIIALIFFPLFLLLYYQYLSLAAPTKANLVIDANKIVGKIPDRWRALAQGGEQKGVRMLESVIPQVAELYPRYIRLDHIYDFYDIVSRNPEGQLVFNFDKLDATVCDIYHTGAKPFFSLGYMPKDLSSDGSLISEPKDWNEWSLLVQKTIERYSGKETRLCGQITGPWLTDIYYEVWNEPELDGFGAWRLSPGKKDYQMLYFYSSLGALKSNNVNNFFLGGPSTASLYKNWIVSFLDFSEKSDVKLDFLSWHHYSTRTEDFASQIGDLNYWLSAPEYAKFRALPRIISEWGYDSDPNPLADTNIGAAHTIASIRNFFGQNIEMAFIFDIKDGETPRWGLLNPQGLEKPRYKALRLLNLLEGQELLVDGEGTFVTALASLSKDKLTVIVVNYDPKNLNNELVPINFTNLQPGSYTMTTTYLDSTTITPPGFQIPDGQLQRSVIMPPNTVVAIELKKINQ